MNTDASRLLIGFSATLILPAIAYGIGAIWNKAIDKAFRLSNENRKMDKAWTTFCLAMPIVLLVMMVAVRFDLVRAVWFQAPFVASATYFFFGIGLPIVLIAAIRRLWRPR